MDPASMQASERGAGAAQHLAILGAGALGSVYGVRLAAVRGTVSFVVRSERASASPPIEIQRVGTQDRVCLAQPSRVDHVPSDAAIIALAVRADNLDDALEALLIAAPPVPVISLTPLMPASLLRLRALLQDRLVVAMPGVVAYPAPSGVIRYWLPGLAPTLIDDRAGADHAVRVLVQWMIDAGIPARLQPNVDTMNPATTMTFLPLVLLLDAAGGTVELALKQPALVKLALAAVQECRSVAQHVGEVPRWAGLLGRFVGPRALRAGVGIAQRTFPESVLFVEKHFGRKTHAQNVLLAREVISIGSGLGVEMPCTAQLAGRCEDRRERGPDA
jgi:ketopantoate reductase